MIIIESTRTEFLIFIPAGIALIIGLPGMRARLKNELEERVRGVMLASEYFGFKFKLLCCARFGMVALFWLAGGFLALLPPIIL